MKIECLFILKTLYHLTKSLTKIKCSPVHFCHNLGVFVNGGNHPGVVPDQTELLFHIEASTTAELQPAVKKCEDCAIGAASATQCTVSTEEYSPI